MGSLVAVDGGRSRCRAAVIGADGRPGPVAEGPGLPPGAGPAVVDAIVESIAATVTSAVVAAAAARQEVGPVEVISAGLAGLLGSRDLAPAVATRLHARLRSSGGAGGVPYSPSRLADGGLPASDGVGGAAYGPSRATDGGLRIVLSGDVVAAHAGALPDADGGVVIVAGTGAVAFGAVPIQVPGAAGAAPGLDSAIACVDGWGHLLGDTGGGFWIGRRGLDAALRAHDGRGGGSPMLARLVERDVGPLDRLPELAANAGAGPVAAIASFSVQVAEAARAGDDVARYIWLEAAGALADSAVACARRLHPDAPMPVAVAWVGGLFEAPATLLLEPFLARMRTAYPAADLMPPAADALIGAARLADPAARGALAPLVFDSAAAGRPAQGGRPASVPA